MNIPFVDQGEAGKAQGIGLVWEVLRYVYVRNFWINLKPKIKMLILNNGFWRKKREKKAKLMEFEKQII